MRAARTFKRPCAHWSGAKHFKPEDRGKLRKFFDKLETDKDNEGDLAERHEAVANTSEPSHARLRSAYTTRSAGPETAATTSRVTARRLRTAMVSMGGPPTMNSSPQVTAKLGHCSSPGYGSDGGRPRLAQLRDQGVTALLARPDVGEGLPGQVCQDEDVIEIPK